MGKQPIGRGNPLVEPPLGGTPPVAGLAAQGPQGPPTDDGDVEAVPTECWQARSQFRIQINMSGGPHHQIPYCWDRRVNNSRGDGRYDPGGWVAHGTDPAYFQRRWCEPDDMYEGSFTIKRELTTSSNTGDCGNLGNRTDCPEYECCCEKVGGVQCGDGAGKTMMSLSWEIWEYVTPAPQAIGKRPPADVLCGGVLGQGPCLNKIQEGIDSFDLCKDEEVEKLRELKARLEPFTSTHEIKLTSVITSVNSRQTCFEIEDEAEFEAEKLAWFGGVVDGEEMWDEIRDMCELGGFMEALGGIFGVTSKLCMKMTNSTDDANKCAPDPNKGPIGYFHMSRRMPTGCPRTRPDPPGGLPGDGNGPSNWFAVRLFGGQPQRELHPESTPPYWEHGESNNSEYGEDGKQGTRENILAIIDAVIANPSDRLCEQHRRLPIDILKGMGKYGEGILCTGLKIKGWEDNLLAFWRRKQPVNMGLAWCLSAVRRLLGG